MAADDCFCSDTSTFRDSSLVVLCVFFFYFCVFNCSVSFLSVSELLMGEVDSSTLLSLLPTEKSRVSGHVFFFFF